MNKLEELEKKYKELGEEIERLKAQSGGRCRGDFGCEYWYIDGDGDIQSDNDKKWGCDEYRFNIGNYFKTEDEAYKVLDKILIYNKLRDLALRLNEGEPVDWKDVQQCKYYIFYSDICEKIDISFAQTTKRLYDIYCLDPNFLSVALDEIGEEDLMKLFEE